MDSDKKYAAIYHDSLSSESYSVCDIRDGKVKINVDSPAGLIALVEEENINQDELYLLLVILE